MPLKLSRYSGEELAGYGLIALWRQFLSQLVRKRLSFSCLQLSSLTDRAGSGLVRLLKEYLLVVPSFANHNIKHFYCVSFIIEQN